MKSKFFLVIILCVSVCCMVLFVNDNIDAATHRYPQRTISITGSYTSPYIVLIDSVTGNIVNKTSGDPASTETWASNYIAGTQHAQSKEWLFSIPSIPDIDCKLSLCDSSSPSSSNTRVFTVYYSPVTGKMYGSDMPVGKGRILVAQ